jgi:hypothetical protein
VVCALTATVASAQFGRGGFFGFGAGRIATQQDFDGRFHYCRVVLPPGVGRERRKLADRIIRAADINFLDSFL